MGLEMSNFSGELSGQVALITGGGSGLGRAYAVALALAGARVAVLSRSADKLAETVRQIEEEDGWAFSIPADVTDRDEIHRAVQEVKRMVGPIDLLINSAGVGLPAGPSWQVDSDAWWWNLKVNVYGPYLCCRAVLPWMIKQGRGRIINVASGIGEEGIPYVSAYGISKTAVIRFTETLALETMENGIRVFAIGPGPVRTMMAEEMLSSDVVHRWSPWYVKIFDEGRDVSADLSTELVLKLASGIVDCLSGCYIHITDDLDEMLERAKEIEDGRLYKLQMTKLG